MCICYIQGEHSGCHPSASCRHPCYGSGKVPLTCPQAEKQLFATLKATYIYCDADSFCRVSVVMGHTIIYTVAGRGHATWYLYLLCIQCRDTYWVESFNHQLLTYLPKHIHFSTRTFNMRMNLALLDWVCCSVCTCCRTNYWLLYQNENVNRSYTSLSTVKDLRRPDCRTPLKVLVSKTFRFVDQLWEMCVAKNKVYGNGVVFTQY